MARTILCLAGDGIGPEIISATKAVLNSVRPILGAPIEYRDADVGFTSLANTGTTITDEVVAMAQTLGQHWNNISGSKFSINAYTQTVDPSQENFEKIRKSVLEDLQRRYDKIRDSIDLNKSMHDNGKATRTGQCYEIKDVADRYQDMLGSDASKYKQMADDLVDMINESAALDLCS